MGRVIEVTFVFGRIVTLPLGLAAAVLLLHNGPTHAALTIATTFVAYLTAMFTVLNVDNIPFQLIALRSEAKKNYEKHIALNLVAYYHDEHLVKLSKNTLCKSPTLYLYSS
jgi:hypothetical protein